MSVRHCLIVQKEVQKAPDNNVSPPYCPLSNTELVDVRHLRILGVLQRLAVSYLVVALMEVGCAHSVDVHQVRPRLMSFLPNVIKFKKLTNVFKTFSHNF